MTDSIAPPPPRSRLSFLPQPKGDGTPAPKAKPAPATTKTKPTTKAKAKIADTLPKPSRKVVKQVSDLLDGVEAEQKRKRKRPKPFAKPDDFKPRLDAVPKGGRADHGTGIPRGTPGKAHAPTKRIPTNAWKPGQSGNPSGLDKNGNKPGLSASRRLTMAIMGENGPDIARVVVAQALDGNLTAAMFVIDKIIPKAIAPIELNVRTPLDALDFDAMSTEQLQLVADAFEKIEQASRMGVRALPGVIIDQDED